MNAIDCQQCIQLLCHLAEYVEERKDYYNELDGSVGDGDLGVTMVLGFHAICEASPSWAGESVGKIFAYCGQLFGSNAPSTLGALFATGFLQAGKTISDKKEINSADVLAILAAAIDAIQRRGKANLGDKTLLDALIPALEAGRSIITPDLRGDELLSHLATVAEEGAEATRYMKAAVGRSRWLQERSIGHLDPGAVVVAELLRRSAQFIQRAN